MPLGCQSPKEQADALLFHGTFYTVDSSFSVVSAVALTDGKIVDLGDVETLKARYDFDTLIDLAGQFVYPGWIDAHCHFVGYAQFSLYADLTTARSEQEAVAICKAYLAENDVDYIIGRGWDQNKWKRKAFPTKNSLDSAFGDIPVYLTRVDGHAAWVNSAVLQTLNIDCDSPIAGGKMLCIDNAPSGILIDNAMQYVKRPQLELQRKIAALKRAEADLFAMGLTSIGDAGLALEDILLIDSLQKAGVLQLRIYAMAADTPENWSYFSENGIMKTEALNVRSFKLYGDGALGSRGASLLRPYSDAPDEWGFLLSSPAYFAEAAARLYAMGFQMNTHAIGDSANRTLLDIYATYSNRENDLRWRIEHAQVVHPDDFVKFRKSNVIPSVQPTHATSDMYWAGDRLGEARLPFAYAYQLLLQQIGTLALGTDFPVEGISPFKTFYAAVGRRDAEAYPPNGFNPEQALSRDDALRGMTLWAAHAQFEENEKGSLAIGKFADFTILDRDILEVPVLEILNAKVVMTFVNGTCVYDIKN